MNKGSVHDGQNTRLLLESEITAENMALVNEYLSLPDTQRKGCGMVAGGSILPLLVALTGFGLAS